MGSLTPRELEVLRAIADGATSEAIAERLGISLHTVHRHREHIFMKLGVRSAAAAVWKARVRLGRR